MNFLERQITAVAIYLRVSSDDQRERGTIRSQRTTLVEYAEKEGWQYVVYEDDGISGAMIENRPGMKSLLEDCKRGRFEAILVAEPSRLTRPDNPMESAQIQLALMLSNVSIMVPGRGVLDLSDEFGELRYLMDSWTSKWEKRRLIERIKRGKKQKLLEGKWAGPAPFGYAYNKATGAFSENTTEAELYRFSVDKILDENWSVRRICKHFFEQGILTRYGNRWHGMTLGSILRSTTYRGDLYGNRYCYVFDPRKGRSRRVGEKPKDEWIKVKVPPLISPERWELLQQRMANRPVARGGRPKRRETFLLRGYVVCRNCGATLVATYGKKAKDTYYACYNRIRQPHERTSEEYRRCTLPYIPSGKLDDFVFSFVCRVLSDPGFVLDELVSDQANQDSLDQLQEDQAKLIRLIGRHEQLDLYVDGNYKKSVLDQKNKRIEDELDGLRKELSKLETKMKSLRRSREQRTRIKGKLLKLKEGLGEYIESRIDSLSFEDKRRLIEVVFDSANDRVELSYSQGDKRKHCSHLPAGVMPKWESMLKFDLMERAVKEARLGKTLGEALNIAERSTAGSNICELQGSNERSRLGAFQSLFDLSEPMRNIQQCTH